ncbi:MAG: phospho-N-acetylmuramoyl-pentapeptide-transferase, partial [Magnetococcales bacterium]|nr:phospho-N-acetylmuramoyl-pentapeptide-transferase [Magnetococcales bacterium]
MLYLYLYPLSKYWSALNLFKYITFRTIGAVLTALVLSFVVGPWLIRTLQRLQKKGQPIREDGPQRHILEKTGTPTMGGTLILLALVIPTLLWADISNIYIQLVLFTTLGFGIIGFWDDMRKVVLRDPKGVSARTRISLQIMISLLVAWILQWQSDGSLFGGLALPLIKDLDISLGWLYYPFAILVIAGCANAVNLT